MKTWLAFLLLLITTTGIVVPCCGADACCADELATTTNQKAQDDRGTCSPFFACATCPGFAEVAKPVLFLQPLVEKQVHHARILNDHLAMYAATFWQPPRSC